jgi:bleomycin hydrolase
MNKFHLFLGTLAFSFTSYAQQYEFQTIKEINCLPVISQGNTGTCWSFSSISFLEAEIIRTTGQKVDLSEMYNVRFTYLAKAENYVMRQGKAQFSEGGLNHDVINSAKKYGLTTENIYSGKPTADTKHDHSKMVAELEAIVKKAVEETPLKYSNWKSDYNAVLDNYLGKIDQVKSIQPKEYGINLNDYVTITSFSHEPFYSKFVLNVPDNFSNESFYNVTLDEFIKNIDNALDQGYTLALDSDVSEDTFSAKTGIAVIPNDVADAKASLTEIKPEKKITQEFRQQEFENYNTVDDHLMHIIGKVKDQKGNVYYKVKNSWGTTSGKDGFMYMSVPFIKLKAISVMVHKDGLTKETRKALNI